MFRKHQDWRRAACSALCIGGLFAATAAAAAASFGDLAATGTGEFFADCGRLEAGPQGCPIFRRDDNSFLFIENTGNFSFGQRVWVSGVINPASTLCLPFMAPGIENNEIGECFEGCGTLAPGPLQYTHLRTDDGRRYCLDNEGAFGFGQRVWVRGCLNNACDPICPGGDGCISGNTIGLCYESCGRIVPSLRCNVFVADDGQPINIENTGGFGYDEHLWVQGCLNPQSTICPPIIEPGVEDNRIGLCFQECGLIVPGDVCNWYFIRDTGDFLPIENPGPSASTMRVWVQGCFNPESTFCFGIVRPGIEDNSVGECFEGCGCLVQGPECVLLLADSGERFVVENLAGLHAGDRVRIRGCLDRTCVTPCGQGDGCIFDNQIDGPLGDMNCDGVVNVLDINPFTLALSNSAAYMMQFPDCDIRNADITCDGQVNILDINPFVRLIQFGGCGGSGG